MSVCSVLLKDLLFCMCSKYFTSCIFSSVYNFSTQLWFSTGINQILGVGVLGSSVQDRQQQDFDALNSIVGQEKWAPRGRCGTVQKAHLLGPALLLKVSIMDHDTLAWFCLETGNTLNMGHWIIIFLFTLSLSYKFVLALGSGTKYETIPKQTSYMKRTKSDSNLKWNWSIEKIWFNE